MLLASCILGCILLLLFEFQMFKDLKTPSFMYVLVWLIVYLSLIPYDDDFILQNSLLPSFFLASLFFTLGFYLICFKIPYISKEFGGYNLEWNSLGKKIIFFTTYILSIIIFIYFFRVVSISHFSVWQAVKHGIAEENIFPAWIMVAITPIRIILFVSYAVFLYTPNKKNKIALLISIPPVLLTCFFTSRGDWFMIIITLVYLSFYIRQSSNKTIAFTGLFFASLIVIIFIISSFDKYSNVYINGTRVEMNYFEKLEWIFSGYFIGPISNFFEWFRDNPEYAYGKYTFRFITALLASLFPDIDVVKTVLEYKSANGVLSNVYTSLNWLARDFGICWAFTVQFFLGVFYGKLYKYYTIKNAPCLITLIMLCMLMMPIVNQFFDDKIFSVMSIWLQSFFTLYIVIKTSVIIRKRPL